MVETLLDFLDGKMLRSNRDFDGVVHVLPRDVLYLGTKGRAKEHGQTLFLGRRLSKNVSQIGIEAHVKKTIGLVDDNNPHLFEVNLSVSGEVQEASGGRDENIDTAVEHLALGTVPHPAVEAPHLQPCMAPEKLRIVFYLHCELSSRRHDKRLGSGKIWVRLEHVEDGKDEGSGFAGTRLGLNRHVLWL